MKRIVLLFCYALAIALHPFSVFAQESDSEPFEGVYKSDMDGTLYCMLVITEYNANYRVVWVWPDDGSVDVGVGYPISSNMLAVAYNSSDAPICTFHVSKLADDGARRGVWKETFDRGGNLLMTPLDAAQSTVSGNYILTLTNPDDSTQTGVAVVDEVGDDLYNLTWETAPVLRGVGILVGEILIFSVGAIDSQTEAYALCGIEIFTLNDDGSISGIWADYGAAEMTPEALRPFN